MLWNSQLNNHGSILIFSMVLMGFLSVLGFSLVTLTHHAKHALENRIWISKARLQNESSLQVAARYYDHIPETPFSNSTDLFSNKELGFRVPQFSQPSYLLRSETTLFSIIDWEHTRSIYYAEIELDNDTITVRKIRRL
jgi:hypothetical protein